VVAAGFGSAVGVPGLAITRIAAGPLLAMRVAQMKALLVSVVAVAVAVGGVAWSVGQTPQHEPRPTALPAAKPQAAEAPAVKPPTEFGKLLARLPEVRPKFTKDEWALVIRDMIRLGPDALPELVAAMDAAEDNYTIRSLTFVARGIGDKRVIPALIRAFPKTCARDGSDCGCACNDPELHAFMTKNDTEKGDGGTDFYVGRAITEVRLTLQQWTGVTHGENELNFFADGGSPRQEYLKRALFHRCAVRWANWWEDHWKEFTTDKKYSHVYLPALAGDMPPAPTTFPRGPGVRTSWSSNGVLQSVQDATARHVFLDLDTGRSSALPERLWAGAGQPERLDDIAAWAAIEGFDLMGTEYRIPSDDKPHYVLRGLGLSAWKIDGDHRETLEAELRGNGKLDLSKRIDGLLLGFDEAEGHYNPADAGTYLFRTREDGFGALFVGIEVNDNSLKNSQRCLGSDDTEFQTIAFYKGRRYAYTLIADDGDPAR
jgi:hypothetical protein